MSSPDTSAGSSWAVSTCWATVPASVLGARPGRVEAREGEEHDEPEQHREAGGEHAEHAGGPVAVVEVAAVGRPAAHQQHGGDGDGRP